jgi:hypothetical protein
MNNIIAPTTVYNSLLANTGTAETDIETERYGYREIWICMHACVVCVCSLKRVDFIGTVPRRARLETITQDE